MRRTKSGLPKYCGWNTDREDGKRRVRFRKGGFETYIYGTPWSETFMRAYAAALDGQKALADNIGADRTIPNTLGALIKAYSIRLQARISRREPPKRSGRSETS
jgi:hypothetical protein